MIGLVLVTHGRLAAEFIVAMEHVVGPQAAVATICIGPHDDMEQRRQDIADAGAKLGIREAIHQTCLTWNAAETPEDRAAGRQRPEGAEQCELLGRQFCGPLPDPGRRAGRLPSCPRQSRRAATA